VSPQSSDDPARPEPVEGELYGPVEVGPMLGRNRFTAADVRRIRASLGKGTKA
jgi:hypothetical protein